MTNYTLLAIRLFVFMGVMLENSRRAGDPMDVVGRSAGPLNGGLALGLVAVGALLGATTGIVGATAVTLGLVVAVLGSIIGGIAAPTEAASMGAPGAIIVTSLGGRFGWRVPKDTVQSTARIPAMMIFILMCAQVLAHAFHGLQSERLVHDLFAWLPGDDAAHVRFLVLIVFVLRFLLEWIEITSVVVPPSLPVFASSSVDPVWLAALICVNLQTSLLTPPFGWALFFLRSVAPSEIRTGQVCRGAVPFVAMQGLGVLAVFLFPGLATRPPAAIGW